MITNGQNTSLLIKSQLPDFVRDNPDYANFKLFLEAYYEWMEEEGKVTERSKNLLNYKDIDTTTNEFIDYFTNDFLPYFPQEILVDKHKAVKIAKELYQTKGIPASYQFLFRLLYNTDIEIFYTKDAVLKASAGSWYIAKSLKLNSLDPNLLNIQNLRLFGEVTKSIATVENAVVAGTKTEVFISNIERLFQSGEFVRVVDNYNQDVLFDGQPLRAKIVGQISQVKIDPNNRGLLYEVGNPVVVYGGLTSNTDVVGATAEVSEITTGSIKSINVIEGGYGYRYNPNTIVTITNAHGATAQVGSVNPDTYKTANVAFVPTDSIGLKKDVLLSNTNYNFSNIVTSNANTTLANAFTFSSFATYPVAAISVTNGGGGISQVPEVNLESKYLTDILTYESLDTLGILAPIKIISGGNGYQVNDTIVFTGGPGVGARANVRTVAANGAITDIEYVSGPIVDYPLGGMGYNINKLPTLTVHSANTQAHGANLVVPGILGLGAQLGVVVDRAGSVTTIKLTNPGEDYVSTPNVSLKVQDIVVSNVSISNFPLSGDVIYQGETKNTATYIAYVDSITNISVGVTPDLSRFNLRVFNYNSNPDTTKTLKIDDKDINYTAYSYKNYGDGNAKGSASFLNGLVVSQGQYLTTQGQPSSFDVLQSLIYNNFTYQITVEKEISKYKDILLKLLHPSGTNLIGRNVMKSNNSIDYHGLEALYQGKTLEYYTEYPASGLEIVTDFNNPSSNVVHFTNLLGAQLSDFIFGYVPGVPSSEITIVPQHGPTIRSEVLSVNEAANTITLASNVWLTFANVATVTGNSGSNVINITTITNSYNIVNNGVYSNTAYPLMDIVYAGDKVLVANNTSKTVNYVDYTGGKIYLTSNLSAAANSYLSVNRTYTANGADVIIYGPIGLQYVPELATEDGRLLTTEDGRVLLLG
jgi:hypothetical protein